MPTENPFKTTLTLYRAAWQGPLATLAAMQKSSSETLAETLEHFGWLPESTRQSVSSWYQNWQQSTTQAAILVDQSFEALTACFTSAESETSAEPTTSSEKPGARSPRAQATVKKAPARAKKTTRAKSTRAAAKPSTTSQTGKTGKTTRAKKLTPKDTPA